MKRDYEKPLTTRYELRTDALLIQTSYDVDGKEHGGVVDGDPDGDIDAKGTFWMD